MVSKVGRNAPGAQTSVRPAARRRFASSLPVSIDDADLAPGTPAFAALSAASRLFADLLLHIGGDINRGTDFVRLREATFHRRPDETMAEGDGHEVAVAAALLYDSLSRSPDEVRAAGSAFKAALGHYLIATHGSEQLSRRAARALRLAGCF